MATNQRQMRVTRERVWDVLSDGRRYADWVVGARLIRDVDDGFPSVGGRLHYTIGRWPLRHDGHTEVLGLDPGRSIELEAHAWPLGTARISIQLADDEGGCRVTIEEHPGHGLARTLHNPAADLTVKLRNVETLRRLERSAAATQA